jgi:hypothetical protein
VLSFTAMQRIFVARDPQDMRRGIDTLVCVVEHELGHEPYTGDCFIFLSRDRKKLKVWIPEILAPKIPEILAGVAHPA